MHPTRPSASLQLVTFRVLCVLGGICLPLLGYLYAHANPTALDPLWLRLVMGGLPIALVGASFFSSQVRREIAGLAHVLLVVIVLWFSGLITLNGLAPEYAAGGLATLIAVGVAGSAFDRLWVLCASLGFATIALLAPVLIVEAPTTDPLVYSGLILAVSGCLLLNGWTQFRMRDRLSASEQRYRTVFERVADGVVLISCPDLRVIASNAAYRNITGYSRQELHGRLLYDLVEARRDEVDVDVKRALQEGRIDLGERRHRTRDGASIDLDIGLALIPDAGHELLCLTARDVSEEKRVRIQMELARDRAQSMFELRTAFLNNMSHELRTPLVSLTGFLDLLEDDDDDLDPEERREMVASLRRSADRLNQTLNAVLDLAQIEGGQMEIHPEPVDMNRATKEAADLLKIMASEKGLTLNVTTTEPARAMVDPAALHRVLLNLFSNAIKFTASGGIEITVEADSHRVFLHVRDTGIGIDPSFLPHLFGAFRQESNGHGREHEGSGLGLTITKRLLDLMGGRIRVDTAPGDGTCISVVFARTWADHEQPPSAEPPAGADTPELAAAVAKPPSVTPLAARPRVLVVEDNLDTARLMERMLQDAFDVDIAPEARTALRLARGSWYDVLLIDIHLGAGMNGAELLGRLRRMSAYAHVPAVAVTTFQATGDRERFLALGFDAYLAKPFTRRQLIAAAEAAHASRAIAAT